MITQAELTSLLRYDQKTGKFSWLVSPSRRVKVGDIAGCTNRRGYVIISVNKILYYAHRLVWLYVHGEFPPEHIDHINGEESDNRLSNLRMASNSENLRNRGKQINNKSGHKGVYLDKRRGKVGG